MSAMIEGYKNADVELDEDGVGANYYINYDGSVWRERDHTLYGRGRDPNTWLGHRSLKLAVLHCLCRNCRELVANATASAESIEAQPRVVMDCVARLSGIAANLRGTSLKIGQVQDLLEAIDEIEAAIKENSPSGGRHKPKADRANTLQVGGSHYKGAIEPWDAISAWGLGFLAGSVIKYVARYKKKNGVEDLKKARHFLDKLIERNGEEVDG